MIKSGSRILAIDDAPARGTRVKIIGVIARLDDQRPEAILSFNITKDGTDATAQLIRAAQKSRSGEQLKAVITHSITLGGLNVLDLPKLAKELEIPIIAVTRKPPRSRGEDRSIQKALSRLKRGKEKSRLVSVAGKAYAFHSGWFHAAGTSAEKARSILQFFEGYPWPLRLAHLIAAGVTTGESKGRA